MDGFAKGHSGAYSGWWGNKKHLSIKTEEKFSEERLFDVYIPLREFYHLSHKAVCESWSSKTEKVIFCSALKTMVKSEIAWNETQKEAFQETALWRVHSFQWVKAFTTLLSLETLSLRNLWKDLSGTRKLVVRKEMSFNENWRETFGTTALYCVHSSHKIKSLFGLSSLKSQFLWYLRKDIWEHS